MLRHRPPGRRDRKKHELRARLLGEAQRLFVAQGYWRTTVEQIADAAIGPHDDNALYLLAEQVGQAMRAQRLMVCTAESCTGGWIAKLCTDLPGSSAWFLGSAVVYDNALKTGLLGVRPQTLAEAGAVRLRASARRLCSRPARRLLCPRR